MSFSRSAAIVLRQWYLYRGSAARVVALRARALTRLSGQGAMAAVELSAAATRERIAPYADRVAITSQEGTLTFAEVEMQSTALASALRSLGVAKGDRVAILLPNCPAFVIADLGGKHCRGEVRRHGRRGERARGRHRIALVRHGG